MSALVGIWPPGGFSSTAIVWFSGACGCCLWQAVRVSTSEQPIQRRRSTSAQQPWWASCCTAFLKGGGLIAVGGEAAHALIGVIGEVGFGEEPAVPLEPAK